MNSPDTARVDPALAAGNRRPLAGYRAKHFGWTLSDGVAHITLARFDYMAQLYRHQDGLKMRELSRYLMVTGGNVTSLTDDLEHDGLVVREGSPTDRRAWIVRLTPEGRSSFESMAREHEEWIVELFAGLDDAVVPELYDQLGRLRVHLVLNERTGEKT